MVKFAVFIALIFSFPLGPAFAEKSSKGLAVKTNVTVYKSLVGKTRQQLIEVAKIEIAKQLKGVDFKFYREIYVTKTSKFFRVVFKSNMSIPSQEMSSRDLNLPGPLSGAQRQNFISFYSSEQKDQVSPIDISQVFRYTDEMLEIADMFGAKDQLSFDEGPEVWRVGVSHPSTEKHSGGWERYSINKKTKERKMIEHEHPDRSAQGGIEDLGPQETDPEVEIKD